MTSSTLTARHFTYDQRNADGSVARGCAFTSDRPITDAAAFELACGWAIRGGGRVMPGTFTRDAARIARDTEGA